MTYQNYKVCLGHKEIPNSSYTVTNQSATGNWIPSQVFQTYTVSTSFKLPTGSDYVLNSASSSYGSPSITLYTNTVDVTYLKSRTPFTAQEIASIEASTISFNVTYTAYVSDSYDKVCMGGNYVYSATDQIWTQSTTQLGYVYTCSILLTNSTSWDKLSIVSFDITSRIFTPDNKRCTYIWNNVEQCYEFTFTFTSSSVITSRALASTIISANINYSEKFKIKSDITEIIDYDALANNYINSISNLTIALSGNNLNVTFTPVTDSVLLDAVDNGDTCVRLQLMNHQPSQGMQLTTDRNPAYVHPIYMTDSNSPHVDHMWAFTRARSHDPNYYGRTWLNLTKAQLQSGSATLSNVKGVCPFINAICTEAITDDRKWYVKVEMFCPAIHRSGKDTFYYERSGHRQISNTVMYTGKYWDWE